MDQRTLDGEAFFSDLNGQYAEQWKIKHAEDMPGGFPVSGDAIARHHARVR